MALSLESITESELQKWKKDYPNHEPSVENLEKLVDGTEGEMLEDVVLLLGLILLKSNKEEGIGWLEYLMELQTQWDDRYRKFRRLFRQAKFGDPNYLYPSETALTEEKIINAKGAQLKLWCKERHLSCSGKKALLVNRLKDWNMVNQRRLDEQLGNTNGNYFSCHF